MNNINKEMKDLRELVLFEIYNEEELPPQVLDVVDLDIYTENLTLGMKINKSLRGSFLNENITLTKSQDECLKILKNHNLFISAPTSFGKTYVSMEYIERNKESLKTIIYVVPTISLMNELRKKLYNYFGVEYVIITSDSELSQYYSQKKKIIIIVPERILSNLFKNLLKDRIDFLVFDEIYKLHGEESFHDRNSRLIVMNYTYKMLMESSKKILLLGPFIKNVSFARTSIEMKKYITDVNLVYHEYKVLEGEVTFGTEIDKRFIYFRSPSSIEKFIEKEVRRDRFVNVNDAELEEVIRWLSENIHPKWYYISLLKEGVGIHHGKTPIFLRKYIEESYRDGPIHTILCTSTLIEGINTPTQSLIIHDEPNTFFTLNNLIGRVGRLNVNNPKKGIVYFKSKSLLEKYDPEDWLELNILYENEKTMTKDEEDEYLYLDKVIDLDIEKDILKFQKKVLEDYGINYSSIIEKGIEYKIIEKFVNSINEVIESKTEFDILLIIKTKILNVEAKFIQGLQEIYYSESVRSQSNGGYINIGYDVVLKMLMTNSNYREIINNFEKINSGATEKDINTLITCLFEIDRFIKFQMVKLIPIFELFEEVGYDDLTTNKSFYQVIQAIKRYSDTKDGYERILTDLGFPSQDILFIRKKIVEYKNVIGTEEKLKKFKTESDLKKLSPFGRKIIDGI